MNENESLTVTLTLENNEELECAVLNIFEAMKRSISHFFHWMKTVITQTVRSICIVSLITEKRKNLDLRTSKKMKSSTVFPLYSTNGWIHRISAISILMH